jgi:hypothetical protein
VSGARSDNDPAPDLDVRMDDRQVRHFAFEGLSEGNNGNLIPPSFEHRNGSHADDSVQVDDITTGGLAPVYAICIGCVADGTEKSTYTSLEKVSLSARPASACALQPALQTA